LVYDEVERNLLLDTRFDEVCEQIFSKPGKVDDIRDEFFQHDKQGYVTQVQNPKYREYQAEQLTELGIRKQELLTVEQSKKAFVDGLADKYPFLQQFGPPHSYLMLDDCTFCT
jgi:hypothetical protein